MMYCAAVGYALIRNFISFYSDYISRDAEGSGVPEMKGVLAGVHL